MTRLLEYINSPVDLKNLSLIELNQLASEIREEMVNRVTANGGHLASSLGVVELTIALHRIFESPRDKIVWDVGHQSYAHKLLTGRREQFASLRQYHGLSGFCNPEESPHDSFISGHASNSISAALGMVVARDAIGADYHVIAVIGDGSITGGMALEALNHAGHLGKRLIVVLNDNGMSISPTVGAMAKIFSRVRFNKRYYQASEQSKRILKGSRLGRHLWDLTKQVKNGLKGLVMPTVIWEEFGFAYLGPIDGHNIGELESALNQVKQYNHKPTLIHVITTKGKGFAPAEKDAVSFHGLSPKNVGVAKNNGKGAKVPSYSDVFAATAEKLARQEPNVVVITAAMPEGNCLNHMARQLPEKVIDVGICEQHAVTMAGGLASAGMKPIVAIYSTFLQRAFDQIIHDVALPNLPVVFALDRAGIVGEDGKTHQGIFDLSYLSLIPNMVVGAPKDENELQHLLYTAIMHNGPMAIRYPRGSGLGADFDSELKEIPIGAAEILREGGDVVILAVGACVQPAMKAAEILADAGIATTVVNVRFVKPFDQALIMKLVTDIPNVITIEENVSSGGFGEQISAFLIGSGIQARIKNLAVPDEFVEHGSQASLRAKYHLDPEGIVNEITNLLTNASEPLKNIIALTS